MRMDHTSQTLNAETAHFQLMRSTFHVKPWETVFVRLYFKVPEAWDTWSNDSRVREIAGPFGHHLSMDRAVIPVLSSVMTTSSAVVFVI